MQIKNLTISLGNKIIINEFTYDFRDSAIYLLKGVNGTGKSTLLKAISGINRNYKGDIDRRGLSIKSSLDFNGFDPDLSGQKNIKALVIDKIDNNYYTYLLENFAMGEDINKKVKKMSLGMQKKTSVIAALVSRPDLLLLDEPFNGLDEDASIFLLKTLKGDFLKSKKKVIIASHAFPFAISCNDEWLKIINFPIL